MVCWYVLDFSQFKRLNFWGSNYPLKARAALAWSMVMTLAGSLGKMPPLIAASMPGALEGVSMELFMIT